MLSTVFINPTAQFLAQTLRKLEDYRIAPQEALELARHAVTPILGESTQEDTYGIVAHKFPLSSNKNVVALRWMRRIEDEVERQLEEQAMDAEVRKIIEAYEPELAEAANHEYPQVAAFMVHEKIMKEVNRKLDDRLQEQYEAIVNKYAQGFPQAS